MNSQGVSPLSVLSRLEKLQAQITFPDVSQATNGYVIITTHSGFLDGSIHSFDLSVCPRIADFG